MWFMREKGVLCYEKKKRIHTNRTAGRNINHSLINGYIDAGIGEGQEAGKCRYLYE